MPEVLKHPLGSATKGTKLGRMERSREKRDIPRFRDTELWGQSPLSHHIQEGTLFLLVPLSVRAKPPPLPEPTAPAGTALPPSFPPQDTQTTFLLSFLTPEFPGSFPIVLPALEPWPRYSQHPLCSQGLETHPDLFHHVRAAGTAVCASTQPYLPVEAPQRGKNWISPGILLASPLFSALPRIHPSARGGKGQIKASLWRVGLALWPSGVSCWLLASQDLSKSAPEASNLLVFSRSWAPAWSCKFCLSVLEKHPGFSTDI